MFRRSRVKKASVNIPKRKWKNSRLQHTDWDSTVSDLSVHKATEEEVQRRRLIHRSKNAGAAKRALDERTKKLADLASPGQVELEMKKLAILKEVLYDHDDLNEVLRRVDNTMTSVKSIFHEAPGRKSGHPNVTLAPGTKPRPDSGPVQLREEQPTQMSLLSESVMDKQALNDEDESSEEEVSLQDKFESKVDYDRFLSVLRESLNKSAAPSNKQDAGMTTPGNDKVHNSLQQQRQALNCTEEVKRTMSRFGLISNYQDADNEEETTNIKRKIDDTITQMTTSKLGQESKRKNQNVSFSLPDNSLPLRANLTANNMTYESLQEAMESVTNNISEMEIRRGRKGSSEEVSSSIKADGLAGFTATLIDAVTRLTVYVNEAEAKILESESQLESLKSQNDHQRALLDALTAELMSTQEQIKSMREESSRNMEESRKREEEFRKTMQEEMEGVKKKMDEMMKNQDPRVDGRGDALDSSEKNKNSKKNTGSPTLEEFELVEGNEETRKEMEEEALKSDMLSLLGALKAQHSQVKPKTTIVDVPTLPMNNKTTKEAAQTVASVESQLRHLQLQHAEAQNRLQELTQVAGFLAGKVAETERSQSAASSNRSSDGSGPNTHREEIIHPRSSSITSGSITPQQVGDMSTDHFRPMVPSKDMDDTDDTISGITISSSMFANAGGDGHGPSDLSSRVGVEGLSPLFQQATQYRPSAAPTSSKSTESLDIDIMSDHSFQDIPKPLPTLLQTNVFGVEPSSKPTAQENVNYLLQRMNDQKAQPTLPAFKPTSAPIPTAQQPDPRTVVSTIQQTQCNLEERIAELNRQHAEAQSRLHNLIRKRSDVHSPSSNSSADSRSRLIQITMPTDDMLKTPQIYQAPEPFKPLNLAEHSFS